MFQIKEITKLKKKMLNYLTKLKRSCNGDLSLEIDTDLFKFGIVGISSFCIELRESVK